MMPGSSWPTAGSCSPIPRTTAMNAPVRPALRPFSSASRPPTEDPMHAGVSGGHLAGCSAVVGGELVTVAEPADVAGVADERTRDHRPDTEQVGERRLRREDRGADPAVAVLELGVEPAHIGQHLAGELEPNMLDRAHGLDLVEEGLSLRGVELLRHSALGRARRARRGAGTRLGCGGC